MTKLSQNKTVIWVFVILCFTCIAIALVSGLTDSASHLLMTFHGFFLMICGGTPCLQ